RLDDPRTHRGRRPRAAAGDRTGPRLRPPPCARGAERVDGPARGLRARLLPAAAAHPPLQPHRPHPASGAGGAPGGLAVSGPETEGYAGQDGGRLPGIDELLERVRAGYTRVEAQEAYDAWRSGDALLVDIRYAALRERDGLIPGALVVERNELEWRLDPR